MPRDCQPMQRVGKLGQGERADPNRYSDIKCDIEAAWWALGHHTAEARIIWYRMQHADEERTFYSFRYIETLLHIQHGKGRTLYNEAVEAMARFLGWRE